MTYTRLTSVSDPDISCLFHLYSLPEISRYISIDKENYWNYVTSSENVYYYKVFDDNKLVACVHIERYDDTLCLSVLTVPEYQKRGIGTAVLKDIQNDIFSFGCKRIEVSVDETNTPSIKLFTKMGFYEVSREDELINYIWEW